MSAKLVESKMRNAGVLIAIVLAVALIGYLFMRRGLGAIDAVIDRQVNIEQALRTSEDQFREIGRAHV